MNTDYKSPLLKLSMNLAGTDVYMYGVGQQETTQKRMQVESHWKSFPKSDGANTIDLKRL